MIISASYKTDIPAFYGPWFRNRIKAGFCKTANPYGGQVYTVPLDRDSVDAFVFWTRDIGPFWGNLEDLRSAGFPFMIQYTVTGYPRALEGGVPAAGHSIEMIRRLALAFGGRSVVWRYDPVLFSTLTSPEFHINNFRTLTGDLKGIVDEVVVSFAQPYQKTKRNLEKIGGEFAWEDPADAEKKKLLEELATLAKASGMKLSLCAQRGLLVPGAQDAHCVDLKRMSDIAGKDLATKGKGHRKDCGCAPSKDIGAYDTCPFGCLYCYANRSPAYAEKRNKEHDPEAEML